MFSSLNSFLAFVFGCFSGSLNKFFFFNSVFIMVICRRIYCDHFILAPLLLIIFDSGKIIKLRHAGWDEVFVYFRHPAKLSPFLGLCCRFIPVSPLCRSERLCLQIKYKLLRLGLFVQLSWCRQRGISDHNYACKEKSVSLG